MVETYGCTWFSLIGFDCVWLGLIVSSCIFLIWLDLIVFGCLLLFLSVSEYINVSDGEDRDPLQKYVIGLCCVLFYVICYCMLCMLYIVAVMWVMVRVGIHQRNICKSAGSDLYAEG